MSLRALALVGGVLLGAVAGTAGAQRIHAPVARSVPPAPLSSLPGRIAYSPRR